MKTKIYEKTPSYKDNKLKTKFFNKDIFDLVEYPDFIIKNIFNNSRNNIINLSNLKNELVKEQVKDFIEIFLQNNKKEIESYKTNNPKEIDKISYKEKSFRAGIRYICVIVQYLNEIQPVSILDLSGFDLNERFINFLNINKILDSSLKTKLRQLYDCLYDYYEKEVGFDRDIWILNVTFSISEQRINKASGKDFSIDFRSINDLDNRKIIKEFGRYLFTLTDLALGTINSRLCHLKQFTEYIHKKELIDITRIDIESYYDFLDKKEIKGFNAVILALKSFYEWLSINEKIQECPIYNTDFKNEDKQKILAIDDYVIHQIFDKLNEVPDFFRYMFLISFSTGMRVSEICLLEKKLLYKEKSGYFIRFFSQKMQKEVTNPICKTLYLLIEDYNKCLNDNSKYLFNSKKIENYPCNSEYFSTNFNKYMHLLKIKNIDGSQYEFKSHSFRHTLATKMIDLDIPVTMVQKMLHHESPEMTLAYTEISEKHKLKKFKEFVNLKGELSPFDGIEEVSDELMTAEWLRESINAQALPNGFCGLPIKLGKCPHANSCLECNDFRTSIDFIDQHKKQLSKTNELINICKQNNWIPQLETNMHNKRILENLIVKLEGEQYE